MQKVRKLKQSKVYPEVLAHDDVRMARLLPIPAILREMQYDPEPVLASIGFDPALFETPDVRVSYAKAAELLVVCAIASATPHFGLLLGQRFDLAMLGALEQLLRNADSVGTAMQQLIRHLHLNENGAAAYLHDFDNGEVALGYVLFRSETPGVMHIYALVLATICAIMRILCGPSWQPIQIMFATEEPAELAPYQQTFRVPMVFNAPRSEVVFAKRWLKVPLKGSDAAERIAFERLAWIKESRDDRHFVLRVRRIIFELMMTGKVSSRLICERLGIHERILRRHLHSQNTSVRELISSAHHELACQLLTNTSLSVAEIAKTLGYSDITAFSRAFRNWTGLPPDRWRRQAN